MLSMLHGKMFYRTKATIIALLIMSLTACSGDGANAPLGIEIRPINPPANGTEDPSSENTPELELVMQIPEAGAQSVEANIQIQLAFNNNLPISEFNNAITLTTDGATVAGSELVIGNAYVFTPSEELSPGKQYTANIRDSIKTKYNIQDWSFTTSGTDDTTSLPEPTTAPEPTVAPEPTTTPTPTSSPQPTATPIVTPPSPAPVQFLTHYPGENAQDIAVNTFIEVAFSENISPSTVRGLLTLYQGNNRLATREEIVDKTYRLIPIVALPADSLLDVVVDTTAGAAYGFPYFRWQFSTQNEISTPKFTSLFPSDGATGVARETAITVSFDRAIQSNDVDGLITLLSDGVSISAQATINGSSYTLQPTSPLLANTQYSVAFDASLAATLQIPYTNTYFTTVNESLTNDLCEFHYEPGFALISGQDNSPISSSREPQKAVPFTDPVYGTCIVRATDADNEPPVGFARNDYSRRQAFNSENSLFFVYALNGFWHLYDATDLSHIKQLTGPAADAEMQWHPSDPYTFFYTPNLGGMVVYEYDVATDTTTTVGDFNGRLPWPNAARVWTKSEGSPSADTRYWGFQVETADFAPLGLMVWDRQNDEIVGTWDFAENNVGRPDHVSMSPSGQYIVASWDGNALGTTAFTRDFSAQVKLHHKSEHSDIALLPNGDDVYVAVDYQTSGGDVFMHNIQKNQRITLFPSYIDGTATAFHFSGKAYAKPGWVLVSSYANTEPQKWLHQKVYAVELKENPRILNIAHHHVESNGYWTEPHASVSRDFTRVLFNSNWETGEANGVDAYMVVLPEEAIPGFGESVGTPVATPIATPTPLPGQPNGTVKTLDYTPEKVLFIGNSLTQLNGGVHTHLQAMMEESNYTLDVAAALNGGEVFSGHASTSSTRNNIINGDYDTVVLQGGSYESIYDQEDFLEHGSELAQLSLSSGKSPVFFMTWHHRETPNESPLIEDAYELIGESNSAPVVPVGRAFQSVVDNYGDISLFSDGTHSSQEGTYLAAAVFYAFFTQSSPETLSYTGGLDSQVADTLRAVAWQEVNDYNLDNNGDSNTAPTLENNRRVGYQAWSTMWNEFGSNNEWGSNSGIPDNRSGSVHKLVGRMYTSLGITGYVDDFTFLPQGSANIDGPEAMAAINDTASDIYVISSYGGGSGICEYPNVAAANGGWHNRVTAAANAITEAGMHPVFFQSHCNGDKKELWPNMKPNSDAVEQANPNMGIIRTAEVIEHLVERYPEYGELQAFDPRGAQYPPPIEVLFSSDGFHGTMALHFLLSLTLTKYLTGVDAVDIPFTPDPYYEIPTEMIERIRLSVDAVQTQTLIEG